MQASTSAPQVFDGTSLLTNGLALLAAVLVLGVLTNTSLPFISGDRAAFFALALIGFTMCAVGGIGRTQATLGWLHPIALLGIAFGIVAMALVAMVATDHTAPLTSIGRAVSGGTVSLVSGERAAFIGLAVVMALKWVLSFGQYFLR